MSVIFSATDISKHFAGIAALDDVSVSIDHGELVGLIGPNGAGKSTLFNCMSGVLKPDAGRVVFNGLDLAGMPPYRRARLGLGRTFQQIELFTGLRVLDHVLIALRSQQERGALLRDLLGRSKPTTAELDRCHEVLGLVGLDGEADHQIESLSLGRARVVELARALICEPQLLFLDEPTSGLDTSETAQMAGVLEGVRTSRDISILLCEHDIPFVERLAERTVVLDCGKLIAEGPTGQVLEDPAVRAAYIGAVA